MQFISIWKSNFYKEYMVYKSCFYDSLEEPSYNKSMVISTNCDKSHGIRCRKQDIGIFKTFTWRSQTLYLPLIFMGKKFYYHLKTRLLCICQISPAPFIFSMWLDVWLCIVISEKEDVHPIPLCISSLKFQSLSLNLNLFFNQQIHIHIH